MASSRVSGLLLHPTSLPSRYGIGDLGPAAHAFLDALVTAGQQVWQVLPLGPTGYGDSPYQCFSAMAGNPLLVSPERLFAEGWLTADDLAPLAALPTEVADFDRLIAPRRAMLDAACSGFRRQATPAQRADFEAFRDAEAWWLDDFATFMALKDAHGLRSWTTWPAPLRDREPRALAAARQVHAGVIEAHAFAQWQFCSQWQALRAAATARGIAIMGDMPIFVAHDSADVWARPDLFDLRPDGMPRVVAGVPPDYFSATGQLWGNPLYRWDRMADEGFAWWVARVRSTLGLVDRVRLDHFRGFVAYWEVDGAAPTAMHGTWRRGPGPALFDALAAALGPLPIVAENLGFITPDVEALRTGFGLPGMAILQFAFGTDPQAPDFLPHNYTPDRVAYTGTHDNDTMLGWARGGAGDSTRSVEDARRERGYAEAYLNAGDEGLHWAAIRAVQASVASTAIVPVQDVLGLGSESRMNVPGRPSGNWRWRMAPGALTPAHLEALRDLADLYGRLPSGQARWASGPREEQAPDSSREAERQEQPS
ncbi:4-alpha-glucanotransferase [Luteitalea sp. TBR-22]|uniref:4-alpha-glucanotransferase n=1 Tax=Luteitalea sp. TBR-22 TaxID=2802971 RepID=UPI001AF0CE34|nr:4-alpha-glucanotransferase [Luteitalea sp. TBR-22]BCS33961.1 4-alpha-glucanotransferase [Luteitalea sp. TBR-22]